MKLSLDAARLRGSSWRGHDSVLALQHKTSLKDVTLEILRRAGVTQDKVVRASRSRQIQRIRSFQPEVASVESSAQSAEAHFLSNILEISLAVMCVRTCVCVYDGGIVIHSSGAT